MNMLIQQRVAFVRPASARPAQRLRSRTVTAKFTGGRGDAAKSALGAQKELEDASLSSKAAYTIASNFPTWEQLDPVYKGINDINATMATKDDIRQLKEDTRLLKEAMATKDDIRQLKEDTRLLKEAVDKLASQSKSDWSMALSGAFGGLLPIAGMVAMKMLTDQTPK